MSSVGGQAAYPGASLYHATKWGIEGFFESTMQDIAPFNIGVTIVEPGGARTEWARSSARLGPSMDVYRDTPAGRVRRIIEEGSRVPPGDPARMARAMIDSVDQTPAPKRLALGSDAYAMIQKALTDRLAALEAQKDLAFSTDYPANT